MSRRSVVIHGHFYQPPREDPWTDRVPRQPSAAPHHDWNERIHDECYRAVVAARLEDAGGRVRGVLNTLEWMSWDAGPTLLRWLARERPETYTAFLEADARSRARTGHGNAMAQPYHHVILPLTSRREKVTEVRWGITDFERRFGRRPDGMWLPEAAVDMETLEVLAQEGIAFTVLGPTQVEKAPEEGLPGRVDLGGGRSIAVFVYDGPLSHDVAFGSLVRDAQHWIGRLVEREGHEAVVSMATDGETFGHHHRGGEMGLAATLAGMAGLPGVAVEGFGAALERHPPVEAIEFVDPSSWSCSHGVERWRADCGCRIDFSRESSQEWRTVLRDALAELAERLHDVFAREAGALLSDPWGARDGYGAVLDASEPTRRDFVRRHGVRELTSGEVSRAIELLEMERDLLRMDTSCAWFFDDIARLEPLQNLLYAAHGLDLAGDAAGDAEERLIAFLEAARSNDPDETHGADFWRREVRGEGDEPPRLRAPDVVASGSGSDPVGGHEGAADDVGGARSGGGAPRTAEGDASRAAQRAVERALRNPSTDSVREALSALDGVSDDALPGPRAALVRFLSGDVDPDPLLAPLARRLDVADDATGTRLPVGSPLRFVFGLHLHQPVGNFDAVFESHVEEVYLPFLERCGERDLLPLALHVSGPLLEWLERRGHRLLDVIGGLVERDAVELLLAGFYEPVLPILSRDDRLQQIGWMREWLTRRYGVDARALWLTERVWEPGLVGDLADAGVERVLVDDRHFLVAGFERHELHRPWRTEGEGRTLTLLPIDERLRYLVPFRSPAEIGGYLRRLSAAGHEMVVLADDGEKFGGWPGTAEWVWERGWLDGFLDEMEHLVEQRVVRLDTPAGACEAVPSQGPAYLPSASYREMELWSLPPRAAETFESVGAGLEDDARALHVLRGGHWRNFLARYEESNRMHKKAWLLSQLCRDRGDPPEARRAIGRAQCNDPYWHGVFGGLYLRHLRNATWANLAEAERILRADEGIAVERLDVDGDGHPDVWVHSAVFSALVQPARGGRLVELTDLEGGTNLADVLTRRRESYHRTAASAVGGAHEATHGAHPDDAHEPAPRNLEADAMPSIHELEEGLSFQTLPPVDLEPRAVGVERVLSADTDPAAYQAADYTPARSWATDAFDVTVAKEGERVTVALRSSGVGALEKTFEFEADGSVTLSYRWDPADLPRGAWFAPELSVASDPGFRFEPRPHDVWRGDIVTVSKKESGYEETAQGVSVTPLWPASLGHATVRFSCRE